MSKKKLLVFLQEGYYQTKLNIILERLSDYEITVISRSPVVNSVYRKKNYSTSSVFKIIFFIFKCRKTKFDVLLAAHIDDFFFHLIHKFTNYQEFITFDEGQRSLIPNDHYFDKSFADKGHSKYKILNFFFKFPLPYGRYFDESSTHFTFYDKKLFNHALKEHKNLILLKGNQDKKQIEKIFIGVSSYWYTDFHRSSIAKEGSLYKKKFLEAAKRINDLNPDLYLMHPRENNDLVGMLNDDIIISKNPFGGNQSLINALNNSNKVRVYTERSGIVFDLDPEIEIVFVDIFERFDNDSFQGFIDKFDKFRKQVNQNYKGSEKISY